MKFSKQTGSFYPNDIAYPVLPPDLVDVTPDEFAAAINRAPGDTLDVVNGVLVIVPAPTPTAAELLAQAQAAQKADLEASYGSAISQNVSYLGTMFQADPASQDTLNKVLTALTPSGSTPTGFYWVDAFNNLVPMTLSQLQGLAAAMMAQGWTAFQHLQTLKAQVAAATTVAAVQAIVW